MTDRLQLLTELAGMALVAAGLWMAWPPAGVIAAGVALIVVGNAPERVRPTTRRRS